MCFGLLGCGSDNTDGSIDAIDTTGGFDVADSSVNDQTVNPQDGTDDTGTSDGTTNPDDVDATSTTTTDTSTPADVEQCTPACGAGRTCHNQECVCSEGLTECGSSCVDVNRDPNNCHACGAPAQTESCNGKDDDCNGTTDVGVTPPNAPCEATNAIGTCVGTWACTAEGFKCDVHTPAEETCDNVDNDCNGSTDEGFKDPGSGVYDSDKACGSCDNDCTKDVTGEDHAHGTCDTSGGGPTCKLVCCTATDPHDNCDGSDWTNTNGQPGDGCEERIVRSCQDESACPQAEICVEHECVPNPSGGVCQEDLDCSVGDECIGGICGCTGDQYTADAVPPNVLIVLDRSGSMNDPVESGGDSKWTLAKAAVRELTEAYEGQVRFGLKLFPGIDQAGTRGDDACGPGAVWFDPAPNNASEINTFLDAAGTSNGTPIAEALRPLVDYAPLEDTTRNNYVVLVTDGMASCDDPVPDVTALSAETPQIRTFVIGFGGEVDPDQLSDMADAGGTAQGTDGYYQADNATSLGEALDAIVGNVLACDYVLASVPPEPDAVGVYFDAVQQPRDPTHSEGWDYNESGNRVTFYGGACDSLLAGTVEDLVFVYGCPDPIIIGGD